MTAVRLVQDAFPVTGQVSLRQVICAGSGGDQRWVFPSMLTIVELWMCHGRFVSSQLRKCGQRIVTGRMGCRT